ncbi:MAG: N-acetylmuramoyl-L-alanine amidase [Fibrobacterota bacterium]
MKRSILMISSVAAVVLLLLTGCAIAPVHTPPPKPWYAPENLLPVDPSGLAGKTVVLDPGHGGAFSGAAGRGGLIEKELNLQVALSLRAMLEQASVRVVMTRDTDRDFTLVPGAHVREDLERRIAGVDSVHPDIFLSVHHNASDDTINMSKTFYKLDDDGASLDAAMRIHQAFVQCLRLDSSELSAGNYFVIRNVKAPAVLGEPSYITHASMEALLRNPEAIRVEAESYFRGLATWFLGGVPAVTGLSHDTVGNTLLFRVQSAVPLDTLSGRVWIDGREAPTRCLGADLVVRLTAPLSNDRHHFRASIKNVNGNSSAPADFELRVDRQPALINAFCPAIAGRAGQTVPIRVSVLDAYGLPVSDATLVNTNIDQMGLTRNGQALVYAVYGKHGKITFQCGPVACELAIKAATGYAGYYQGFIKNETSASLPALVKPLNCPAVSTDANGFFQVPETCDSAVTVCAWGFDDASIMLNPTQLNSIIMKRAENGRLFGKRIVIDPEFGGMESGGMTRSGIRAADINRKLSQALFDKLRRGGADVVLARAGDESRFISERVGIANKPLADIYVLIRTDTTRNTPHIANYPNSQFGGLLNQSIREQFSLMGTELNTMEVYNYVLQQSPCTAIEVAPISMNAADPMDAKQINQAAECIANGISSYFEKLTTQKNSKK